MFEDGFLPISPGNFFEFSLSAHKIKGSAWESDIEKARYLLPETSWIFNEEAFSKVFMGWSEEGLHFQISFQSTFNDPEFPALQEGDSVELFIDTRDVKTSGFNTKFCHHFFFLPDALEGHIKGEITRFRTEDKHDLCFAEDLFLKTEHLRKGTKMKIMIPSSCLTGYDPAEFKRLGFSYRINSRKHGPQHFSARSDEYAIEQEPSLWASVQLTD